MMATQATQPIKSDNSDQLEPGLSIGERTKALILDVEYDAPAFKNVQEFRQAFDLAEKGAHEVAGKLFRDLAELIKYCAMVRSYLSERGTNAHLRKEAGIPAGFERWYTEFRNQHDIAWAYKTMLHKIAELEGGCEHCGRLTENDADHKKSCILYRPLIELGQPEENGGATTTRLHLDTKETANAYLADRCLSMIGLLTNAPKETSPEQIFATMQQEAQSAYEDLDGETAKRIKIPKLVAVKPNPLIAELQAELNLAKTVNASLLERLQANTKEIPEHLRDENITANLAAEPDTDRATDLLKDYLQTVIERVLPPHMKTDHRTVEAPVQIVGRDQRIMPGDWVRQQDRYKQDAPISLIKCTGIAEFMSRRRVREWENGEWTKEHVIFDKQAIHCTVITEQQARELMPQAFENS